MKKYFYTTFLSLSVSLVLLAQTPDSSFGTNGNAIFYSSFYNPISFIHGGYVQPGGRILVGATTSDEGGYNHSSTVSAFTPDGHIDSSFGKFTGLSLLSGADVGAFIAPQLNNKIVAAGIKSLSSDDVFLQVIVERLTKDGIKDSSFGVNGSTTLPSDFELNQQVRCIAVDSSDYIYIGGSFYTPTTGDHYFTILRLTPNGTVDSSFRVRHTNQYNEVCYSLQVLADGSLIAGYLNESLKTASLIKYKHNGTRDSSFGSKGLVPLQTYCSSNNFLHLQRLADGSVIAGTGDDNQISFYKVTAAGQPDRTFSSNGVVRTNNRTGYDHIFTVDDQSRILLPLRDYTLKRILANGATDSSFGNHGYLTSTLRQTLAGNFQLALHSGDSFLGIGFYTDYTYTQIVASKYLNANASPLVTSDKEINPASIKSLIVKTASIYPNPVKSVLTVSGLQGETQLAIVNAAGQVLMAAKTADTTYRMDISKLSPGVYYLRINSGLQTVSFVKE